MLPACKPLGRGFNVADVIASLECEVVVVGKNKLGTLNHTLLTTEALRARGVNRIKVVLMDQSSPDISARSNAAMLKETLANIEVLAIPHLGVRLVSTALVKRNYRKIKKTLARITDPDSFSTRSSKGLRNQAAKRRD